jgi:hypothetical protein
MSNEKNRRREAKRKLRDARAVLAHMDKYLDSKNTKAIDLACAFFHVLNYHLEEGDLMPTNIHMTALLQKLN